MANAPTGLRALVSTLFPGAIIERVAPLGADEEAGTDTEKAIGYGEPLRVGIREPAGWRRELVFRTAAANEYGHDRRSDRAEAMLLAHDLFNLVPDHVRSLDVGAVASDGRLVSLKDSGEFWLLTEWAPGTIYAEDLRRVAHEREATPLDVARCEALARWLARLHAERLSDPVGWRRAVRDLLGHGEGIFGVVDAYPPDVPGAPADRLRRIEERCLQWRWRLRERADRLARTHGDFHPFNVVFRPAEGPEPARFALLDASRGGKGDPADDVVAMAVNYVFFAVDHRAAWARGLGVLWRRFWETYFAAGGERAVLESAPPFLAWRALVLASPRFYPHLSTDGRDALLRLAERALEGPRFDPTWAEVPFAEAAW
jgi:hypothetical protein